jgi:hypothetical protein
MPLQLPVPGFEDSDFVVIEENLAWAEKRLGAPVFGIVEGIGVRIIMVRYLVLGLVGIYSNGPCHGSTVVIVIIVIIVFIITAIFIFFVVVVGYWTSGDSTRVRICRSVGTVSNLEDFEALVGHAHITEFYLWTQDNYIDGLQDQLLGVEGGGDMICDEGNIEGAKMWDLGETLKEVMLNKISISQYL